MSQNPLLGEQKEPLPPSGTIGRECDIRNSTFGKYTEVGDWNRIQNSSLDDYSYTGQSCWLQNTDVGKFSNIAAMVRFGPTAHPIQRVTLHHFTYRRKLYGMDTEDDHEFFAERVARRTWIGHDTWIGHGAVIMPGVVVGDGSVVGAGAVVTHDVEPYTIVVGVPARKIKDRFSAETAKALVEIAWWQWEHEQIRERLADFSSPVEEFIEKYGVSAHADS
jgi:phosphonate metabolism protein (transferase hexapeptide repeat family)